MRAVAAMLVMVALLSGCAAPEADDFAEDADGGDGSGDGGGSGGDGDGNGGEEGGGETPPEGVASVAAATWAKDDSWTYRLGIFLPDAEEPLLSRFTLTVEGEDEEAGMDAYRVHSDRDDEDHDSFYTQDDLSPIVGDDEVLYYDFPLWVGKRWRVVGADPTQPGDAVVEARESRDSAAGAFDAWRIRLTYESGGYETYWFADAVRNEVRREVHGAQFQTVTELEAYDVGAA